MVAFKFIFSLVFTFAGVLLLSIAYREWRSNYSIIQEGIQTEGTVVETYRRPKKTGELSANGEAPIVQFRSANGAIQRYYSTLFTSPCNYQPGQTVSIWYLEEDPLQATLNGKDAWVLPIVFGIFGTFISLIAVPALLQVLFAKGRLLFQTYRPDY